MIRGVSQIAADGLFLRTGREFLADLQDNVSPGDGDKGLFDRDRTSRSTLDPPGLGDRHGQMIQSGVEHVRPAARMKAVRCQSMHAVVAKKQAPLAVRQAHHGVGIGMQRARVGLVDAVLALIVEEHSSVVVNQGIADKDLVAPVSIHVGHCRIMPNRPL